MFLRILAGFVLFLALVWVVLYLSGAAALRREAMQPGPYGLGSDKQAAELPPYSPSAESERLATLVQSFADVDVEPVEAYVAAQIEKINDTIDPPPPDVKSPSHEAIAELVPFVIANADRLSWSSYRVAEVTGPLAVDALDRAKSGDARAAWDAVHTIWILARVLAPPSGWRSKQQALFAVRNAAGIARKLPAPAPPWVAEIAAFDPRRQTAVVLQSAAKLQVHRRRRRGIQMFFQPFIDYTEASRMRNARMAAEGMAASKPCRAHAVTSNVFRAARMQAELEAMTKVLALKAERTRLGRWPATLPDGD